MKLLLTAFVMLFTASLHAGVHDITPTGAMFDDVDPVEVLTATVFDGELHVGSAAALFPSTTNPYDSLPDTDEGLIKMIINLIYNTVEAIYGLLGYTNVPEVGEYALTWFKQDDAGLRYCTGDEDRSLYVDDEAVSYMLGERSIGEKTATAALGLGLIGLSIHRLKSRRCST